MGGHSLTAARPCPMSGGQPPVGRGRPTLLRGGVLGGQGRLLWGACRFAPLTAPPPPGVDGTFPQHSLAFLVEAKHFCEHDYGQAKFLTHCTNLPANGTLLACCRIWDRNTPNSDSTFVSLIFYLFLFFRQIFSAE